MPRRRSSALSRIRGTRPSQRLLAALAVLLFLSGSAAVLSAATFTATTPGQVTVNAAEDFSPPTAAMTVDPVVKGIVRLTVDAQDDRTFVTRVVVEQRPAGGDWTTVCTITSADTDGRWTCGWNTTGQADGEVSLRATATDSVGLTAKSPAVTTLVDNTAPTASLTLASPLRGTVTIDPTVADAGSGIASVTIEHRTGTGAWVTLCTRTTTPYGCSLDTTTLTTGATYEFRVTARDIAGNTNNTATATATVDNTTASVSITSPAAGAFLRGEPTITAAAAVSPGVVGSVAIQWRTGSGSWTTICTDDSAPYSCSWNVRNLATGNYDVRAVMTYGQNDSLASAPIAVVVDNTPLNAVTIQGTPGPGVNGRLDEGDTFTFTYSTVVDLTTIKTGWTAGATDVTATLRGRNNAGTVASSPWLEIPGLGELAFSQDIANPAQTTTGIPVRLTASSVFVNGYPRTVITATIGKISDEKWLVTGSSAGTLSWTPLTSTRTPDGRALISGTVSGPGAL